MKWGPTPSFFRGKLSWGLLGWRMKCFPGMRTYSQEGMWAGGAYSVVSQQIASGVTFECDD